MRVPLLIFGPLLFASVARAQTTVRDSAAIRIVTSSRPLWSRATQWSVEAKPFVQIGSAEAEEAAQFTSVFQISSPRPDLIAVVDYQAPEIRLFSSSGQHLRTIGRKGNGPGEFGSAPTIAFVGRDTVVAYDPMQLRLSWFSTDGKLARETSFLATPIVSQLPKAAVWDAWQLLNDGTLISTARELTRRPPDGLSKNQRAIRIVPAKTTEIVQLGLFPLGESYRAGRWSAGNPFAQSSAVGARSNSKSVFVSLGVGWELQEYGMDGKLRSITRAPIARRKVTSTMIADERRRIGSSGRLSAADRADLERAFDALSFPDSTPAIGYIFDDGAGNIWVQRFQGDATRKKTTNQIFDIVDSRNRWLGTVTVPPNHGEVVHVSGDRIFTVWLDDMDVEHVRGYQIRKPKQ